ncbi:MAG: radical SAM protein, partial [Ignavibacteria bacterium]|nr:radical SAM protein [Ignavibacteria bacterium]
MASSKNSLAFVDALLKEMELRKDYLQGEQINTIYFGGGTPSLLPIDAINRIADKLHSLFTILPDAEITLEANPDDVSAAFLKELKATFVNRLSIGIQSYFADDLKYLNRVHDEVQARKVVEMARNAGFNKFSIDLIYGIPTLTDEKWEQNLDEFFSTGITHLS